MIKVGSIDLDALKSRMSQLKGNESCNEHNLNSSMSDAAKIDGTYVRRPIRVSSNPSAFGVESIFAGIAEGDQVRVLVVAGRSTNVVRTPATIFWSNTNARAGEGFLNPNLTYGPNSSPSMESSFAGFMEDPSKDDMLFSLNLEEPIVQAASIGEKSNSYARVTSLKQPISSKGEASNFQFVKVDKVFDGVDISMHRRVVKNVSSGFENTLYGYFIGKRIAFPIMEYFVTRKKKKPQNVANSRQTQESGGNGKPHNVVGNISSTHIPTSNPFDTLAQALDEGTSSKDQNDGQVEDENNYYVNRRALWTCLESHAVLMRNSPWVLLGDFNAALNLEDHSCGGYEPNAAMREFKECVNCMEVMDINSTGRHYQSSCVLHIPKVTRAKPKPFKFFNFLVHKERFHSIVEVGWNLNVEGFTMYLVVKRLKGMKSPLRNLLHDQGNLHDRVNKLHIELDEVQKALDREPTSTTLQEDHAHYLVAINLFHKVVKSKCARNRIEMVRDASNVLHEGNEVPEAFVAHYKSFLGAADITDGEIKDALFSIRDDRALEPDGFTSAFFKKAWDVVGGEITLSIRDFFTNDKLIKELNLTIISLIPKVTTPARINNYRPISCYNVFG
ncbi:sodium/hydrogen exchanger 6 [Tanacetum coccineum]